MLEVLQSRAEVQRARERLRERGLSALGLELNRTFWQRLRDVRPMRVGDDVKSWDVLRAVEFLERVHPRTARVLDLGAYCSEVLCSLHLLGYSSLTGVDLNPAVRTMPYGDRIRWRRGDFLHAPFRDGSFDVLTSISVIEHGFDSTALLTEARRLLAPGGSFVASFDYWPEKIETGDTKFFGLDWRIFSREEVERLVAAARAFDLVPAGPLHFEAADRPVSCAGRDYTFAWMALRRA